MPLMIEMTEWGAGPIVVCDHCGEPIEDAGDGNYQWLAETEHDRVRRYLFFTHKGCCDEFEATRGGAAAWYAMELIDLLPFLARNLNLDWGEAEAHADLMRWLG
jgi:hypothetical protein